MSQEKTKGDEGRKRKTLPIEAGSEEVELYRHRAKQN